MRRTTYSESPSMASWLTSGTLSFPSTSEPSSAIPVHTRSTSRSYIVSSLNAGQRARQWTKSPRKHARRLLDEHSTANRNHSEHPSRGEEPCSIMMTCSGISFFTKSWREEPVTHFPFLCPKSQSPETFVTSLIAPLNFPSSTFTPGRFCLIHSCAQGPQFLF